MATGNLPRLNALAITGLLTLAFPHSTPARDLVCKFQSRAQVVLAFGPLDPARPSSVATVPATAADSGALRVGDCSSELGLSVTADTGRHFSGGKNRLKHTALDAYLAYTVTVTPRAWAGPGNGNYLGFSVTGWIEPYDYADLPAGEYTDSLLLVVTP